jgi:hypothetical protein
MASIGIANHTSFSFECLYRNDGRLTINIDEKPLRDWRRPKHRTSNGDDMHPLIVFSKTESFDLDVSKKGRPILVLTEKTLVTGEICTLYVEICKNSCFASLHCPQDMDKTQAETLLNTLPKEYKIR